ncbi:MULTISPECIES: porphobilinogen synthase [Roseiflexus]|uniref:Delta-aminolevulinic acid dehydratase n=1 Tax=Roseiflexus castenholzii (strain DSM 13941 / HLO8) TaxID=383372 RepID=A7NKV0_ROSCS|nr:MULTISPECIES: porphobilinogen synthase [Roseiflexus]ABU58120.1 Porphobilinogen synthase [Roseiflexus castenholzii DSM 13941]GIW01032.1 MAG: delta-aminolevulinic acid dehydratase [Roseiflexus sp.]
MLINRPRRLRRTPALRRMVCETVLSADDLIAPLFVVAGSGVVRPIRSMPGHAQISVDQLDPEISEIAELQIPAVLLFGIPAHKDPTGSSGWDPEGPVPQAIRAIKRLAPQLTVIADVCVCEYTSHGHCGILAETPGSGDVLNDPTLEILARCAVAYADAGADIVAPSAMMDGQVAAIRAALDAAGYTQVAILSYAAKFASAFYGPFREAAESTPAFGDRRAYQMDPANGREALREVELDIAEGADMIMVKPAGAYLDIISTVRQRYHVPLAAYQVSGEYAMIKAAAQLGWLDERRAALESLIAIRRAGADMIITYFAKDAARWIAAE